MLQRVDELMPIGEFSQRSGLSPKRLRSYAAGGLLLPTAVDAASGYRYYAPGQLREARLIDALREAGMSLAAIGSLLRDPSAEQVEAWARHVETEAAQRRDALELARELLAIDGAPPTIGRERSRPMRTLQAGSRTETGHVRANNQDALYVDERLAVVADGMGGHPGGDVAAALAVALVPAAFTGRSIDELEAGVRAANRTIWDRADRNPELDGMGTTVCAIGLTEAGDLAVVNVGDSRVYLWRGGSLTQLTEDHSVTAELVRRGELAEHEALQHPYRGVLTRVLGGGPQVEPASDTRAVLDGDRFLLCTDGLFNELVDDEVAELLAGERELQHAADALVEAALARGGRDNVAVVVAEISAPGPETT